MDEQTEQLIVHILRSLEINRSPVVYIRDWFPSREGKTTFRVVTDNRELFYVSLPKDFSLETEQDTVEISAVKCEVCDTLVEDFSNHPCEPYTVRADWHVLQKELGE